MSRDTLSQSTKSRTSIDDVPSTYDDHLAIQSWKVGDILYGSFAKGLPAWQNYREDIEAAFGNEDDYYDGNVIYVDTFKSIKDQLEEFKK